MKPSVGRVVHYVAYGTPGGEYPAGICRAAIVTEVYDGPGNVIGAHSLTVQPDGSISDVGLCVLNPTGQFFNRAVPCDNETKRPGTWHWPERVE